MRGHRRIYVVLTAGVFCLLLLRFTSNPQSKERKGVGQFSQTIRQPEPWWKFRKKDRDGEGFCVPGPESNAPVDIETYQVWDTLNSEGRNGYIMEDNYWLTLTAPRKPPKRKLQVFLMPHSHADPGWLRTYLDYSSDTNRALDYALDYLTDHPNMTFTWNEVAFFQLWWSRLSSKQQALTKTLIAKKQLELTSGSWTMTDEASPYYWATIDNIVEGHQFLASSVGSLPSVEWSNDPFGYGPSVPFLFREAGLSRLALNRVHKGVKMWLEQAGAAVFRWRQRWDDPAVTTTKDDATTTHLLPFSHYDVPNSCGPDPSVCCQFDFKRLTHFFCPGPKPVPVTRQNVAERAAALYDQYRKTAEMYPSGVLLILLGDDFRFIDKEEWSQQHDNYIPLFKYMNSREDWNIDARFGTFSDYFDALQHRLKEMDSKLPTLSGDFFPYNDFADHYWTGYFTSRPHYKRMDRILQAKIRNADLFSALAFANSKTRVKPGLRKKLLGKLESARRNLALFQHHDAITGTSKPHVVKDYGKRLQAGIKEAAEVTAASVELLLSDTPIRLPKKKSLSRVLRLADNNLPPAYNLTELKKPLGIKVGESVRVSLANGLGRWVMEAVRVVVTTPIVSVRASDGGSIPAQVNPVLSYTSGAEKNHYEVVFLYKLAPMSVTTFTVTGETTLPKYTTLAQIQMAPLQRRSFPKGFRIKALKKRGRLVMETEQLRTRHDPTTGLLQDVEFLGPKGARGITSSLELEFLAYKQTRSGAYLFMPNGPPQVNHNPCPFYQLLPMRRTMLKPWPNNATVVVVRGPIMQASHSFLSRIHTATIIYNTTDALGSEIGVENTVDLREMINTELVMRLKAEEMGTDGVFYTDSIGLQMMKRKFYPESRMETNYFPMPSAFVMQDDDNRLSILSGQPHGATSPADGVAEIMLDRISIQDDFKGLGSDSPMDDNVPARSLFRILLEQRKEPVKRTIPLTDTDEYSTTLPQSQPSPLLHHQRLKETSGSAMPPLAEPEEDGPLQLYHSLHAHLALQSLLFSPSLLHHRPDPPTPSPTASSDSLSTSTYRALWEALPCDTEVVSFRPLPASSATRLLITHRSRLDCHVLVRGEESSCGSSEAGWGQFYAALGVKELRETQLSGLTDLGTTITAPSPITLTPNDFRTFRTHIRLNHEL